MIPIPKSVYSLYDGMLRKSRVAASSYSECMKWLRYYLDFCDKHVITDVQSERVCLFLDKLRAKGQTEAQC